MSLRASSSMTEGCGMCGTFESSSECEEEEEVARKPEGGDGDRSGEGECECAAVTRGAVLV